MIGTKNTWRSAKVLTIIALAATTAGVVASHSGSVRAADAKIPAGTPAKFSDVASWTADEYHAGVDFSAHHLGLSIVKGRFDDVTGTVVADPEHLDKSSVDMTIKAASVDTRIKMRDDDLRSDNFLDTDKYPTITFKSTRIEKAHGHDKYVAYGDLTIHGVTKSIALPFTAERPIHDPFGGLRFSVLAHTTINRLDYGVSGDADKMANGEFVIGPDLDIDINLELVPGK